VSVSDLARVTAVEFLGARALSITFSDGLVRELDFATVLPDVLASIDNDESFAAVVVDPIAGTVAWPNGIGLDPDVLHGDQESASATQPRLLCEYRPKPHGCSVCYVNTSTDSSPMVASPSVTSPDQPTARSSRATSNASQLLDPTAASTATQRLQRFSTAGSSIDRFRTSADPPRLCRHERPLSGSAG
jgi:hypothetical protein